jgi:putative phosphoesterase
MKKIGILSDTHTFLDERVFVHFKDCDEIWHLGDFGNTQVADQLLAFKPLKGVVGNVDGAELRRMFPLHNRFMCEEVDVWLTHIGGYPGNYSKEVKQALFQNPPRLFVTGHSHILKVQFDKKLNLLHINPGAEGKSGFHHVRTLVRLVIDGKDMRDLEVIELS